MTLIKPVLVTGSPRSGTTWVGRILTTSSQLYYIHEPFNPDFRPGAGICNVKFNHHQTYITPAIESSYYKPIRQMVKGKYNLPAGMLGCKSIADIKKVWSQRREFQEYRRRHMLPLIKDPIALMSAGWMGSRFDMDVIVMIRHPAAFVTSMKRLNWTFEPRNWALSQPMLLGDYLSPLETEMKDVVQSNADMIDRLALLWKVIYFVVLKYKEVYQDWIYLRHEDIARDPLVEFKRLFGRLGLDFTNDARKQIEEHSNASNPSHAEGAEKLLKLNSKKVISQWKNVLTPHEVIRIKDRVEEVSKYYYSDSDWKMDDVSK